MKRLKARRLHKIWFTVKVSHQFMENLRGQDPKHRDIRVRRFHYIHRLDWTAETCIHSGIVPLSQPAHVLEGCAVVLYTHSGHLFTDSMRTKPCLSSRIVERYRFGHQKFSQSIFPIIPSPTTSFHTTNRRCCFIIFRECPDMNLTTV